VSDGVAGTSLLMPISDERCIDETGVDLIEELWFV
jgi:hypothetical protein